MKMLRVPERSVVDVASTAAAASALQPNPDAIQAFRGRFRSYLRRRGEGRRLELNVFCPTGPGGGVDPSCGKGGQGRKVTPGPAVKQITGRLKDPKVKKQVEDTLDELRSRYPAMAALKPITTVDLRKGEAGGGEYYGDGGVGAPTVMIIYAEGLPLTSPKLEFGGDVLIGSVREAVAHEYGHHLWDGTKPAKRKEWQKLYGEVGADGWKKVSDYAASHPEEGFSESLAAFTHPSYSGGLPAAAEGYFRKLLGGGGKENASVLQEYSPLPELLAEYERLRKNAFCPTGKGGGVDPTCSPGGGGGSGKVKKQAGFDVVPGVKSVKKAPDFEFTSTYHVTLDGGDVHSIFFDRQSSIWMHANPKGTSVRDQYLATVKAEVLPRLVEWQDRYKANAFCPTGKGGGVDPTCTSGGKPGPKTKIRTQHRMRQAAAGKTGEGKGKKPPAPATPKPPEPKPPAVTIDYDQADPHHPEARKIWDDHGGRRRLESFLAKTAGMEAEGFKLQELRDKAFKLGSDHHTATQEWLKLAKSKSKAKDHPKKLKAAKANMDRLRAEHDEAISARNEAIKQADTLPERGRAALLEVMGVSSPSVVAYSSKGKKTYDWESEGLEPTGDTKVAIDDGLGFASRLTGGGHKSDVKMSLSTDGRGHYIPGGPTSGAIAMGRTTGDLADLDSGKKKEGYPGQRKRLMEDTAYTAAHEVGHHYENTIPGLRDKARAFLDYRLQGEPVIQMNRKPGMSSLRDDEHGAKDRFDKAFGTSEAYYVGKQYHRDTEVVSMGLQKLYQDPVGFARRDPEYFQWLTTALRGGG